MTEEELKIEEFLSFLDQSGYNFHVLAGIRSLLRQPISKKWNDEEDDENVFTDANDELTGETILAG